MDMETLHAANKYADKITAGMASGIKSHTVDEENNSITFHFNNGDSVAMKINTPMKDVEKAVNVYLHEKSAVCVYCALSLMTL